MSFLPRFAKRTLIVIIKRFFIMFIIRQNNERSLIRIIFQEFIDYPSTYRQSKATVNFKGYLLSSIIFQTKLHNNFSCIYFLILYIYIYISALICLFALFDISTKEASMSATFKVSMAGCLLSLYCAFLF